MANLSGPTPERQSLLVAYMGSEEAAAQERLRVRARQRDSELLARALATPPGRPRRRTVALTPREVRRLARHEARAIIARELPDVLAFLRRPDHGRNVVYGVRKT